MIPNSSYSAHGHPELILSGRSPTGLPQRQSSFVRPPAFNPFNYAVENAFDHDQGKIVKHISSYPKELLFELYPVPDDEFESLLSAVPSQFGICERRIYHGDGITPCQNPEPKLGPSGNELKIDDTNY
jgi:hypothetical protein